MFFAELGARVLKVENKRAGGDVTRSWRLPNESREGISAYYSSINYGKEIWSLDLSDRDDRETILAEIATCDVVISNYQPATALKLGMDYQSLATIKSDLIYVQLDGYYTGHRPAFDVVLQAETGWMSMTGTDADQPAKLPVALVDVIAGHQLKEAALLAIIHRMRSGEGSYVQCNLEQASLTALANQATNYLMEGAVAQPIGTLHPNIAPYGDWFTTLDGHKVVLAIGSDAQFESFCESSGISKLKNDSRFATNAARVVQRSELAALIKPVIASQTYASWHAHWSSRNIPFGEIKNLDKVLESPAAKALIREEIIEGKHTKRLSGNAFNASFLKP